MSQFDVLDSNDNELKEGNKLTSISNRDQKLAETSMSMHKQAPDG